LRNNFLAILALAGVAWAGPVEFGRAELDRAIAARHLNPNLLRIKTEVAVDPPESYRIIPGLVTGGDLRGLMYGLLEAADQIRRTGRLQKTEAAPAMSVRGARVVLADFAGDLEWFRGREQWPALFRLLAMNRFNRFQLAVPDLAGLISLPEFPQVPPREGAEQNLDALHFISETAADYGIDFTLGVWTPQATDGPYFHAALGKVLAACPAIRGVQLRMSGELAADAIRAVQQTGRRATIEAPADARAIAAAASDASLPVRFYAPFAADARPAKGDQFFWELGEQDVPAAARLSRLVERLAGTGGNGFEIDLPPGEISKPLDPAAAFLLLGRLAYDAKEPR
jgi:hypothetical protein